MLSRRWIKTFRKLPKGIVPKAPTEGTRAFEYLSGKRKVLGLWDDPELKLVIDDKHAEGGLLYVFKDHSSVVYDPPIH